MCTLNVIICDDMQIRNRKSFSRRRSAETDKSFNRAQKIYQWKRRKSGSINFPLMNFSSIAIQVNIISSFVCNRKSLITVQVQCESHFVRRCQSLNLFFFVLANCWSLFIFRSHKKVCCGFCDVKSEVEALAGKAKIADSRMLLAPSWTWLQARSINARGAGKTSTWG